jgi:alpha-mannosidase
MPDGTDNTRDTFLFVPHTHWEGAVFKTREQYLEMGLPIILRALRLLKKHPDYRFTLDQVCYVEPFLRRYPEERDAFQRFVDEGRLAIVGGTDTMLDCNIPGGESYARQMLYGKGFFRRELGVNVTTGWNLDTFGHHAQMPQLLKLAGYKSYWFARGVASMNHPSEFLWEGIDGTRIPAFWVPHSYAITYGSPDDPAEFARFMEERFAMLDGFTRGEGRVGLAGADVCKPEEHVPNQVIEYNKRPHRPFDLTLAVPAGYEAIVDERVEERPVVTGEMNPIFQGAYSSRIELKQAVRDLENQLTTAEKLGVMLNSMGEDVDAETLWPAWEPMLFNQAHDIMAGVLTDHVYQDTVEGFDHAARLADSELHTRLDNLASRIDTQGEGVPLIVFNPLSWRRDDLAIANVGFTDDDVFDLRLLGPDGDDVPFQIMDSEQSDSGSLVHVKIAFVARDIPPIGYATFRLLPLETTSTTESVGVTESDAVLENEYYRLDIDPGSGAITGLLVKDSNWAALSGAGNVVTMEEDHGDLWELYRNLDAGSRVAMTDRHPAPESDRATFSNEQSSEQGTLRRGSVVSEFEITRALGETGEIRTRVTLYAGLRRIEVRTDILNNEKFVRYRALFPTTIRSETSDHEIPFGAIERPDGIEFPAQNWIDYSDGNHGLALLNRGLPGNNVADGTMMLSLMRSTSIVAYGFGGGYEPGMSSDTGYELGKKLGFDYALVPHAGDWRDASVYRDGLKFNNPLMVRTAACRPGVLPSSWGFLEISHPNVVVSALKPGENGGVVLRLYEAEGKPARTVRITPAVRIDGVVEVNLIEDHIGEIEVVDNTVVFDLEPHEIKTIRFDLQDAPQITTG